MTINEHLSAVRLMISRYEDDSKYNDPALYHFLKIAIATIAERAANKNQKVSDFGYFGFCIKLEKHKLVDCDGCLDIGCDVLRSPTKIPGVVTSDKNDLLKVYTLDMVEIGKIGDDISVANLDPVKAQKYLYDIVNGYLVIYNGDTENLVPQHVYIKGVWEDITEWSNLDICAEDTDSGDSDISDTNCFDLTSDDMPIPLGDATGVYKVMMELMGISLKQDTIPPNPMTNEAYPH